MIKQCGSVCLVVAALLAAEEQDVGLGAMDGVVHPAAGLLDADGAPLVLAEEAVFGEVLCDVLREDHVSVVGGGVGAGRKEG